MIDKKELYAKLIDSINEFNLGAGESTEAAVDCVSVQMLVLAQILATIVYTGGGDKMDLTTKVLGIMPMLDKMAEQAYDDLQERDIKVLFPNVKGKA